MLKNNFCCSIWFSEEDRKRQRKLLKWEDGRSGHIAEPVRLVLAFFIFEGFKLYFLALSTRLKDVKVWLWKIHLYHIFDLKTVNANAMM